MKIFQLSMIGVASRVLASFVERHDAVMARYSLIPVDGPARSCWWYVLAAAQNLPATGMPLAVLLSAESRWRRLCEADGTSTQGSYVCFFLLHSFLFLSTFLCFWFRQVIIAFFEYACDNGLRCTRVGVQ